MAVLALKGAWRGLLREVFGLLALGGGVLASIWWGKAVAERLGASWDLNSAVAPIAAHGIAFLLPYLALRGVGFALHRVIQMVALGGLDRAGGALFGGLSGAFLSGAGVLFLARAGWGGEWLRASSLAAPLAGAVRRAAEWMLGLVS